MSSLRLFVGLLVNMAAAQAWHMTPAQAAAHGRAEGLNHQYSGYIFIVLLSVVGAMLVWRMSNAVTKYLRTMVSMNNETQNFFTMPNSRFATVKKHLLYAPIFKKRHNRELALTPAITTGGVPSRLQLLFIAAIFGVNITFSVVGIDFSQPISQAGDEFRNRAGVLAVTNMVPLFFMAGRNNPLIALLNISFDNFNLLHRWFGRIVVLEILTHFIAHSVTTVQTQGWASLQEEIIGGEFMTYGFVGFIAAITIGIQTNTLMRHAFYETFKIMHIALVIVVVVMIHYHLSMVHVPFLNLIYVVISIWVIERVFRFAIVAYRNFGKGGTKATVEALPGNACRVTVDMARPWTFKPGQHSFLYVPGLSWWQSHPFSVAWSEEQEHFEDEKIAMTQQDVLAMQKTKMSFVIRARTGFTSKLFNKADACPYKTFSTSCIVEGPYGGHHNMHSYGTVLLFAGGVGISYQVAHVRDLVAGHAAGTIAARKVVLVWTIQDAAHLEWIRPWMTSILAMDRRREVLRIQLYVSRPRSNREIHSPSASVQMFPGRPNIDSIIAYEVQNRVGAMGVSVCGSGSFSDDVRAAVRACQHAGNIDYAEEAFSW